MKTDNIKKIIVLSTFIFFIISISNLPVMTKTKAPTKTSLLNTGMAKDLKYMRTLLNNIKKFRDKSRRIVAQAESLVYIVNNLLEDCSAQNPETDIPLIRSKMTALGFILGNIRTHTKKFYYVNIDGLKSTSSIKLKEKTRIPFFLLVRVLGGKLDFDKIIWNRYIEKAVGRLSGSSKVNDIPPVCSANSFPDIFTGLTRVPECKYYIKMVENEKKRSGDLHEFHKNAVSSLRSIKSWIEDNCSRGEIPENRKKSLRRCADSIKFNLDKAYGNFEKYINNVSEWITKYETCKKNEVPVLRR